MENLISPIPENIANILVNNLYGRKIIIKSEGLKYKGRVTDVAYDGNFVKVNIDHSEKVISLGMDTYFKLLK